MGRKDARRTDRFTHYAVAAAMEALEQARLVIDEANAAQVGVLMGSGMGGAETLDQEDKIGSLTPGKQADLIIIDPGALNFAPQLEQINQIVFTAQPDNVTWVFVAGKPLKQNGQLVGVDLKQVLRDAQTAVEDIAPAVQP
jgi:5-methylthioadenosine/S-adenosylhomocysteine deaminase